MSMSSGNRWRQSPHSMLRRSETPFNSAFLAATLHAVVEMSRPIICNQGCNFSKLTEIAPLPIPTSTTFNSRDPCSKSSDLSEDNSSADLSDEEINRLDLVTRAS